LGDRKKFGLLHKVIQLYAGTLQMEGRKTEEQKE